MRSMAEAKVTATLCEGKMQEESVELWAAFMIVVNILWDMDGAWLRTL